MNQKELEENLRHEVERIKIESAKRELEEKEFQDSVKKHSDRLNDFLDKEAARLRLALIAVEAKAKEDKIKNEKERLENEKREAAKSAKPIT